LKKCPHIYIFIIYLFIHFFNLPFSECSFPSLVSRCDLTMCLQGEGALAVAAKYCSRLLECGGAEEEWAKQQLRDIRSLEQGR
jgi:hypothetical protein